MNTHVAEHLMGRVRLWGETHHHYLEPDQPLSYQIKCKGETLSEYLRDAKALRLDLIDRRNNSLYGWVEIPLLVYLKPQQNLMHSRESPLLPIDQPFPIMKQPGKEKCGETDVCIKIDFYSNNVGEIKENPAAVVFVQGESLINQRLSPEELVNATDFDNQMTFVKEVALESRIS
jgi:hypothetical protein